MILREFHVPFPVPGFGPSPLMVTSYIVGQAGVREILATPAGVLVAAVDGRIVLFAGGGWALPGQVVQD